MRAIERGRTVGTRSGVGRPGTRGVGRLAAMVIALAVVACLLLAGEARAGTYRVAQCGWGLGAELDPTFPTAEGSAFSLNATLCAPPPGTGPAGMKLEGGVAPDGALGLARARWVAPAGTRFAAAHLTWSGTPQPGNWQGLAVDIGGEFHLLTYAVGAVGPTPVDVPIEGPAWAFEAFIQCLTTGLYLNCTRSTPSVMRLSGLVLTLEDGQAPGARLGGSLLAPGWHRGAATLELAATDVGAGVAGEAATIDGASVLAAAPACAVAIIEGVASATKLAPCPSTASQSVEVDTTRLADGPHTLRGCATDFAGDQGCAPEAQIEVDNSPPSIAFAAAGEGEVAATVSDPYSGPASGTISVRAADATAWTDLPTELDPDGDGTATLSARLPDLAAGTYLFRAAATDAAGNSGSSQLRVSGSAAEVRHQAAGGGGGGTGTGGGGGRSGDGSRAPGKRRATRLTVRLAAAAGAPKRRALASWDRSAPVAGWASRAFAAGHRSPDSGSIVDGAARRASSSGLTVDYGTAAAVRGRLTDRRGEGVAGRPIVVVTRAAAGTGAPERQRVVTDGDGRFGLRLPGGTSRRVVVSFRGGGGFAPSPRRSLALRVRAAVSLAAEPTELDTGESVRLHGHVLLGPAQVSRRGKLVAIQYLERATGRWRPALVVRTDAKGRFDTKYRFRYVTGLAEIRLRATAPAEGGWPFARGSSAPVTVTVHGR
jgi:hypothetical protein